MSNREAMKILALFRPGTSDEKDPSFDEARKFAQGDPALRQWFEEHCASHKVLRGKFQEIVVPPGLKEQIISERAIQRPVLQRYWGALLAVAAVVLLLVSVEMHPSWLSGGSPNNHEAYVRDMAELAQANYTMNLETDDPVQIRAYLAKNSAPADYAFPTQLQSAATAGCAIDPWQGTQVSMICFKTGRPLRAGSKSDMWLFVAQKSAVADAPAPGHVTFERAAPMITASWSDDSHTYVLAALGDEALLKQYLP
jgi:hypothetical protein